jgi:hypothetical protein
MATQVSGTLITRNYSGFRGVDFSNRKDEINLSRSPDALNMWKNYKSNNGKCIETRPDVELLEEYSDTIFGLFFYDVKGTIHKMVHSGDKLYDNGKQLNLVSNTGNMSSMADTFMAKNKSNMFVINNILYILDGSQYMRYDGTELNVVDGYIPTTTISRSPNGGGTLYEDINLLNDVRRNSFCSDGASKEYKLDVENFDSTYPVRVWIDDKEITTGFTAVAESGIIKFNTAPKEPNTPGADNVVIQFRKVNEGYRDRINNCRLVEVFDNRVFFSGNPDYPNFLWHSSLDNPEYCSDLDYYTEGTNDSKIQSIVSGNNAIWVMKEPSQSNTTIFYHTPTVDADYGKIYPSVHSSISTGCATTGVNFNDTICFFSERGLEAISGDVTTEQVIRHVSSLVDNKLLNESKFKDMILEEWEGYLLVIVGNKVYLADSRAMVNINGSSEFEWFYWEFKGDITSTLVKDGVLYLCSDDKVKEDGVEVIKHRIYTLTKTNTEIEAYWSTLADEFKYPHYQKTTNKKGCVVDMEGESITISTKIDHKEITKINDYKNTKGYVVPRIKKKKWKSIQLIFSSNRPFSLYSATLEAYVGSYVKR